jgi:hypothetical protein
MNIEDEHLSESRKAIMVDLSEKCYYEYSAINLAYSPETKLLTYLST